MNRQWVEEFSGGKRKCDYAGKPKHWFLTRGAADGALESVTTIGLSEKYVYFCRKCSVREKGTWKRRVWHHATKKETETYTLPYTSVA